MRQVGVPVLTLSGLKWPDAATAGARDLAVDTATNIALIICNVVLAPAL